MLILTRRVGETLMIGDEVTVTVLGVKGNQVRIGVNAPKRYLYTVKRSTSVSRLKNRNSPVTELSRLAHTGEAHPPFGFFLASSCFSVF